ncbi:CHASE3 domain-containing protein [Oculatella sp. LEGE 06141]|uniref:CHASE3 domain-containing protein n=1 Tax=Oculatella sp. LEGE 06141 TaxID=1828648 RepID=UPI0018825690|nr:CHASE3 domain-containing protein [Oculatella sp. LEGE 06141]MBE9178799.1 CHASE3 domain-containing protein [Oculatella sp. LEGE 06141]
MLLDPAQTNFRQRLSKTIAMPIVLLLLFSGVSVWQITRLLSAIQWLEHTDAVIAQANHTQKLLLDSETGIRGYFLAQEREFLQPYEDARGAIEPAMNTLEQLVDDNPLQVQRVIQLRSRYQEWENYVPALMVLVRQQQDEPLSVLRARKQLMDGMRRQVATFIATEESLRDQRSQRVRQTTVSVVATSIVLAIVIGAILAYYIQRQLFQVSDVYETALQTAQVQTETAQRSAQRLAALHDIDRAILAAQSLESLAHEALSQLISKLPGREGGITLLDAEVNEIQTLIKQEAGEMISMVLPLDDRLSPDLLTHRDPVLYVADLASLNPRSATLELLLSQGYLSVLSVVMMAEGKQIGNLNLFAKTTNGFNQEDQDIAREVADQLAIAVQQSKLREQLQGYTEELERRVAERTIRLQESNDDLEAFSYSVSHDLRAPLRTMQGFAQALLEDYGDQLDAVGQEYTHYIIEGAIQMDTLIADLLNYSRLSRTQVQLQSVSLETVVNDALKQLNAQVQEQQAEIKVDSPLPRVMAHRSTLTQVVTNLLTNAMKFVEPDQSPSVQVYAQEHPDSVRLWIADNGIGIAPEHQDRVFRVFERLHGVEIYPGTGIGLAIVRKGIERMNGRVGVESAPGQGSRFWLELPAAERTRIVHNQDYKQDHNQFDESGI